MKTKEKSKKRQGFTPLEFFKNFIGARKNNQKTLTGFTLIELLVVIAIIGILSTIVMVSLNTARSKARDARRINDVRQLQLALAMYYDAVGTYPAALANLATTYIPIEPKDPKDGTTSYLYCVSSTLGYHLGSNQVENAGGSLSNDADVASDGCTSGSFSGADGSSPGPYVYDITP